MGNALLLAGEVNFINWQHYATIGCQILGQASAGGLKEVGGMVLFSEDQFGSFFTPTLMFLGLKGSFFALVMNSFKKKLFIA